METFSFNIKVDHHINEGTTTTTMNPNNIL